MRNEKIAYDRGYRTDEEGNVFGPNGNKLKGWIDKNGYHYFRVGKKTADVGVHRLQAYQIYGEALYEEGIQVRHLDGNQKNNTPSNLRLGTKSQNEMDKSPEVRRRAAKQAASVIRKLTDIEADELRKDRKNGMSYKEICLKYGLAKSTVSYIVNNKTYLK